MTSKEFIQNQIKQIETTLKDNKIVFSKEMKSLYEDDLKHYNQVLKDLEALEILKGIIEVVENTKDTAGPRYYIKLRQDVILNEETLKFIKECD